MTITKSQHHTPEVSFRRIFIIALPVLFANIAMPLQSLIDISIIARLADAAMLAGLGLAVQLITVLLVSFNFLQYSSSGLVAQALGANLDKSAKLAILQRALMIATVIGLIIFICQTPIQTLGLKLLAASPASQAAAISYLDVRFIGVVAELANYAFVGFLAGMARTRALLLLQSLIAMMNIALSLYLVQVLGLGLVGAAWGTVIAQWLGVLIGLYLVARTLQLPLRALFRFRLTDFSADKLKRLFSLNKDIFIRTLLLTLSFAWITRLGSSHGDVVLAANILLLQVLSISASALDGLAVAAESLCGQLIGAKNRPLLMLALKRTGIAILLLAITLSLIWWWLMPLYLDTLAKDSAVRSVAYDYALYAALLPTAGALAYWLDGIYFGMTAGRQIRDAALIVAAGFFSTSFVLHQAFGVTGIWLSVLFLLLLRVLVLGVRLPTLIKLHFKDNK